MSECDFQLRVSAYHDRELGAEGAAEVERHLGECAVCSAELAALRQLSGEVSEAVGQIRPEEFARLRQAVGQAVREAASEDRDSVPMFRTMGLMAGLAASVLIVSGVWLMELKPAPSEQPAPGYVALAPEWQRVAVTLYADPRPEIVQDSLYAPRYARHMGLMLDGLMLSQR